MNELLPLITYCFLMSSTPGPNNVMLTAAGANFGYRGTLPQILGINSGVALQTFLMCLGLGQVFLAWPLLHELLRVAGAAYLVWLAWKLAGSAAAGAAGGPREPSFLHGVMFQLVNPKSWVKAITLASVFMPSNLGVMQGAAVVALLGLVVGFPCASMWTLFGVAIRRWLADPRRLRVFNALMGLSLFVLALSLLRQS